MIITKYVKKWSEDDEDDDDDDDDEEEEEEEDVDVHQSVVCEHPDLNGLKLLQLTWPQSSLRIDWHGRNWVSHIHGTWDKWCGDDLPVRVHNAPALVLFEHLSTFQQVQ